MLGSYGVFFVWEGLGPCRYRTLCSTTHPPANPYLTQLACMLARVQTVMIANIWGEPQHVEETLSTLRFASRVRSLTTDLHMAESNDPGLLLKK